MAGAPDAEQPGKARRHIQPGTARQVGGATGHCPSGNGAQAGAIGGGLVSGGHGCMEGMNE